MTRARGPRAAWRRWPRGLCSGPGRGHGGPTCRACLPFFSAQAGGWAWPHLPTLSISCQTSDEKCCVGILPPALAPCPPCTTAGTGRGLHAASPPHCQWGVWLCPASGPLTAGLREAGCVDGPQIAWASGPPQSAQALHPHRPIRGIGPPCSSWGDGRSETRTWAHTTRRGLGCARAPTLRPAPRAPPALQPPGTPSGRRSGKSRQEGSLPFLIARFAASSPEQIQEGPLLLLLLSWLRRVSSSSSCEEPGLPSRGSARLSVWSPGSTFPSVSGCQAPEHRLRGCGARTSVLRGTWGLPSPGSKSCALRWQGALNPWTTLEAPSRPFLTEWAPPSGKAQPELGLCRPGGVPLPPESRGGWRLGCASLCWLCWQP